ncbi:MAG: hypothetical protein R3A44_30855 [Caldilineaceae bacterium]
MADVHDLVPLDAWRREQPAQQDAVPGAVLREDQLYAIDGGVFRAKHDEDGRWALHTWMGKAGYEVTRTGFEVDADGGLYDRLYDVVDEIALVLVPARFSVVDLQPIQAADVELSAQAVEAVEQAIDTEAVSIWDR